MTQKQADYLSYLLRLWRENGGKGSQGGATRAIWRASLETPSGESHGFASLDDLCDFLYRQISAWSEVEMGHSAPECPTGDEDQISG